MRTFFHRIFFGSPSALNVVQAARQRLSVRSPLSENDFLDACGVPATQFSKQLVISVRNSLAHAAKIPPSAIYPADQFDGEFGTALVWAEFEPSLRLLQLAEAFQLTFPAANLEKVVDPSSPFRRGSVSDLIRELHDAFPVK